jgi:Zn-dependent protease
MKRDQTIILVIVGVLALVVAFSHRYNNSVIVLLVGVAIPSIVLHEVSHGVVALWFGDDTAKLAGRISLNPIRHVDVFGTLILPALLALSGFGVFGYAKPVPINPNRMRHPANDAVLTSLAGPATNVLLALAAGLWLRQGHPQFLSLGSGAMGARIAFAFGIVNVDLAVFNLIPIPPLDGSAVVGRFLPKTMQHGWEQVRRYGAVILIIVVLLRPTLLGSLFNPAINGWLRVSGL